MLDTYWQVKAWLLWWESFFGSSYMYAVSGQNNPWPLWFSQLEKFKNYDFGRCPRVYCCGQPCLPVGQSDIPRAGTVKIYCPRCEDVYYPRSKFQGSILNFFHDHMFNFLHARCTFVNFVFLKQKFSLI